MGERGRLDLPLIPQVTRSIARAIRADCHLQVENDYRRTQKNQTRPKNDPR